MPKAKKNISRKRRRPSPSLSELHQVEFHRHGFALVPDPGDRRPGVANFLKGDRRNSDQRSCSCSVYKKKTCSHILKLIDLYKVFQERLDGRTPDEDFRSSVWFCLAGIMANACQENTHSAQMHFLESETGRVLKVVGSDGEEMIHYMSQGPDVHRFIERFGQVPEEDVVPHRGAILEQLGFLTLSYNERIMAAKGFKTNRQVLEESFWYRFAYHSYREFAADQCTFHPSVEETSGAFTVTCKRSDRESIFNMVIPRKKVRQVLSAFNEFLPNQHGLAIHPIPLKSLFKVSMKTKLDMEVRPMIQLLQEDGETRFFEREEMEKFRYGDLVYIKEMGILAELEPQGKNKREFVAPVKMVLKKSQVPSFLREFGDEIEAGTHIVDVSVKKLKIFDRYDRVDLTPEALDRDWCWFSMNYGFGNTDISLVDIIRAKKEGQRYIPTKQGWVDCQSVDFEFVNSLLEQFKKKELKDPAKVVKLSRMDLLRLQVMSPGSLNVTGKGEQARAMKRLLKWRPAKNLPPSKGVSSLRQYQKFGKEWLYFLFENGLGGLLCDEMGLGKTHQIMALMVALLEHGNEKGPFLVVCPTTVLSHWDGKIREHAPGLNAVVFYGGQRDLEECLGKGNVLLTSYGILRNDISQLRKVPFTMAVFDEIQSIKNPKTRSYEAAKMLDAGIKLGLTGTPIENTLWELKTLFDLTVPGYLGTDESFFERYIRPIEDNPSRPEQKALSRLISPFILRRLKKTVLDELPDKIEDIRTCRLSDDQVKLYRDALASRGVGLIDCLRTDKEPVPYMHIFALLNMLKQICDHPALIDDKIDDYEQYRSGKWELFEELILECLDSEQKVVIYSQYLGMIRIIEKLLQGLDVGHVTLTGASRKRGEIVARFNEDPDCRFYVGSLRAGGIGIDLVAASVVIHYDRWWNAAREDQATDRVHRIGQTRGVQVFKLLTEGTLEEKISAIIEKKRNLMDSIIKEDNPNLLKTFSREDLIEMLTFPS